PAFNDRRLVESEAALAIEGDIVDVGALDACSDFVHAEGRREDHDAIALGAAERSYQQIDCLIAAPTDEHPVGTYFVQLCKALDQTPRLRFGIAVQSCRRVVTG